MMNRFKLIKMFFMTLSFFMVYLVIDTSLKSNLFEVLPVLTQQPWFNTTIVDFYFNVAIVAAWVIYKEQRWYSALAWVVSFVCLGSIATCLYVALQFCCCKGEITWEKVLLRKKA